MKMKEVLEQLKQYAHEIDLSARYNWDFDRTFLDTIPEVHGQIDEEFQNSFERNVDLKFVLSDYFRTTPHNVDDLHFWIINEWGGIRNFKNTSANRSKIQNFKNQIQNGRLTRATFSTISSLSKLSSFWDCKNFVIYDSRVIYALNWLILKMAQERRYFPTPSGRNEIIANYDIDTIVRLYHLRMANTDELYYSYKDAYIQYCQLMKDWSIHLWDGEHATRKEYPFYLEMLLFCISDKEIFADMKDSVNLAITK